MIVDHITLKDLSIFDAEEDNSVFNALNYARTVDGRHWLRHLISHPYNKPEPILETQQALQLIIEKYEKWPQAITNGTLMVLDKFYESMVEPIPASINWLGAWWYKLLNSADYSFTSYTVGHCIDFLRGLLQLVNIFENTHVPNILAVILNRIKDLLQKQEAIEMAQIQHKENISKVSKLRFGYFILYKYNNSIIELLQLYAKLDAYYALATASLKLNLHFPTFNNSVSPYIEAESLYHILLKRPVTYEVKMDTAANFIFLTGANMAGKSTFIKAVGISVYLAHLGMGVPAKNMQLSIFNGLLSNINVVDNVIKGESYFYNEVQRIKNTITKINDGQKWMVLIDELFKGTNVQDAMRCSIEVIKGLLKIKNSLFILSTHLYEIGDELKPFANIAFRYFETKVVNDLLCFSFQLKEGISNDRLGYLILKREGVLALIEKL